MRTGREISSTCAVQCQKIVHFCLGKGQLFVRISRPAQKQPSSRSPSSPLRQEMSPPPTPPPKTTKMPLTLASQGLMGIRQRLILPGRVQPSTFSTGELNFCVRDGNRWNLSVIATGNGSYFVFRFLRLLSAALFRSLSCTLTTAHRMILQTISN